MKRRARYWIFVAFAAAISLAGCPNEAGPADSAEIQTPAVVNQAESSGLTDATNSSRSEGVAGLTSAMAAGQIPAATTTSTSLPGTGVNIDETNTGGPAYFGDGQSFTDRFGIGNGNDQSGSGSVGEVTGAPGAGGDGGGSNGGGSGGGSAGSGSGSGSAGGNTNNPRGAVVYAGVVSGTRNEEIINVGTGSFAESKRVAVGLTAGGELDQTSVPGFAILPDMLPFVMPVGHSFELNGSFYSTLPFEYSISFRTTALTVAGGFGLWRSEMRVRASGGALTITGTASHSTDLNWTPTTMNYDSRTTYRINLFAQASGQPDVYYDTVQDTTLSGTLNRQ